jgi:hypothetical protein
MGLVERRLAKEIQDTKIPEFKAELKTVTGFEPELDIKWDTFIAFDEWPLNRLRDSMLPSIMEVMKNICIDDMGKDALKAGLTKIILVNTDKGDDVEIRYANKELYVCGQMAGDSHYSYGSDHIQTLLEKNI